MMRGMYSAISGLRNHQIMLDVTANDLANVNTVGFKASRTSFRDSLAQLQRSGASATTGNAGAKSAQIGLGVQLGSIDNLMTNGAFQSTGSPYDVAITGNGWFRVSNTDPTAGATASDPGHVPGQLDDRVHPRGQLHPQRPGRAHHAGRLARRRQGRRPPTTGGPIRPTRHRHQGPRRRDRRLGQPRRRRDLHALGRRHPRDRRLPVAGLVPERGGPGPRARPTAGRRTGSSGAAVDRHARRQRPRPDRRRPARDEQRRPGDRVHQHDHRAAWLRGQLACALDHATRCCRPSSTSSTRTVGAEAAGRAAEGRPPRSEGSTEGRWRPS